MKKNTQIYLFGIMFNSKNKISSIKTATENIEYISYKDISAIVSNSMIKVDLEASNKKVVGELLIKHQKTLEEIMSNGNTVLPLKLGTYFNDESQIEVFLQDNYQFIKRIESSVIDKIEIDIIAFWADFSEVIKNISLNEKVLDLKEKLMSKSGGVTPQDQQQLGFLIAGMIKENNKTVAGKCYEFLKSEYLEFKNHDVMNDEMVFNTSFLIDKNNLNKFNNKIDTLDENLAGKLNFRYVGPLPCYSFYGLEIVHVDFNKLQNAQEILMLNDVVTLQQIKKAYREKAVINHPDKKGEIKSNFEFDQINKAYRTLLDYFYSEKSVKPDIEKIEFLNIKKENGKILLKLKD